ncbi:hypothetical protein DXG01_011180 [Tephrocybe rancida]|nr:hypothetical protein DXG01_011180 [Tephrocybe rancida]
MIFYVGTSILSVVYIDSPFRLPILIGMAQRVVLIALRLHTSFVRSLNWVGLPVARPSYFTFHMNSGSLRDIEHDKVMQRSNFWGSSLTILESLKWLVNQSTNQSVTQIVAEAASSLLMGSEKDTSDAISRKMRSLHCFRYSDLLLTCTLSLEQRLWDIDSGYDPNNVHIATWESLIQIMFEAANDGYQIGMNTGPRLLTANHLNDTALCERILAWSRIRSEAGGEFLKCSSDIAFRGGAAGARALMHKFPEVLDRFNLCGRTLFHHAASFGNVDVVAAILEDHPSIISIRDIDDKTALEHAAMSGQFDMVDFLLQQGAERPLHLLHKMIQGLRFTQAFHLLERGWSPLLKDEGETAWEIANRLYHVDQGTLHQLGDQVNVPELGALLDKMKLVEGELSKSECIDNPPLF